jgi:charged multivesicular body protein 5
MEELLRDADEFQEILSRSYGLPDELDEADLASELDALTDELLEQEVGESTSYLDEISTPIDSLPIPQQPMVGI